MMAIRVNEMNEALLLIPRTLWRSHRFLVGILLHWQRIAGMQVKLYVFN